MVLWALRVLPRELDVLDPYDYVIYQSERSRGSSTDSTNFVTNFGQWSDLDKYKSVEKIDWQDSILWKNRLFADL